MCFFVQINHTRKELLFLMFKEINLRNHSSLHKLFYSLDDYIIHDISPANIIFYNKRFYLIDFESFSKSEVKVSTLYGTRGFFDNDYDMRSEEHTSELQSRFDLVCRLLLEE